MTTEQYSIGYEEGYQNGWNEAIDNELSNKSIAQIEIKNGHWINTPFADVKNLDDGLHNLYTSPQPSKPWVSLTEEEAEDIWNRYCDEMGKASINDAPDITRAIEAKLREKNA